MGGSLWSAPWTDSCQPEPGSSRARKVPRTAFRKLWEGFLTFRAERGWESVVTLVFSDGWAPSVAASAKLLARVAVKFCHFGSSCSSPSGKRRRPLREETAASDSTSLSCVPPGLLSEGLALVRPSGYQGPVDFLEGEEVCEFLLARKTCRYRSGPTVLGRHRDICSSRRWVGGFAISV
ncbi:hypothetical protein GQ53DRAFT_319449 [Thozetella sp. PMI_491]|nr:hypothetical protein GQ53DRAFT_319449 [Thozetella sp. PMI_491]